MLLNASRQPRVHSAVYEDYVALLLFYNVQLIMDESKVWLQSPSIHTEMLFLRKIEVKYSLSIRENTTISILSWHGQLLA